MQADWSDIILRSRVLAQGATQVLGTGVALEFLQRVTLARLRGNAVVHMDPGAAGDSMVVGLGAVLVSDDAFTAGSASVPSPLDDADYSWIYHQLFVLGPAISATEVSELGLQNVRVEIDSKAQRKCVPGQVLTFVWDAVIIAGSPTYDGNAAVREMALLA